MSLEGKVSSFYELNCIYEYISFVQLQINYFQGPVIIYDRGWVGGVYIEFYNFSCSPLFLLNVKCAALPHPLK